MRQNPCTIGAEHITQICEFILFWSAKHFKVTAKKDSYNSRHILCCIVVYALLSIEFSQLTLRLYSSTFFRHTLCYQSLLDFLNCSFLLFFFFTHLFRSLYRLMSFSPFLRSPLMLFCTFAFALFRDFVSLVPFLQFPYKCRVCNPIETTWSLSTRQKSLSCHVECSFLIRISLLIYYEFIYF